jgi:adenosylhomocysteine nucleosidase
VIGLVVAMPSELRHVLEPATLVREEASGPWRDLHLDYQGRRLIAVCSGIGMVNAAAATTHLIEAHQPGWILNSGCAGAHRPDILPGDVVIGSGTVAHGATHILPDGNDYFPQPAQPDPADVMREIALDAALVNLAQAAAAGWSPDPWPFPLGNSDAGQTRGPVVHTGVVASADTWTQSRARLDVLHGRHQSLCEDMEAAAIAQVCARYGVPFLTFKDISNNEFLTASDLLGEAILPWEEVGKRSAALLLRVAERL